jgi:hypothetical protein
MQSERKDGPEVWLCKVPWPEWGTYLSKQFSASAEGQMSLA